MLQEINRHRIKQTFESKTIYELKPNNPTQIAKGQKQLAGYKAEVEQEFGGEWTTVLDTY